MVIIIAGNPFAHDAEHKNFDAGMDAKNRQKQRPPGPVQQLLVICGLAFLNPFVFAVVAAVATVPLAALSWFLVEKRAMALKSRLQGRGKQPGAVPLDPQPAAEAS